MDGPAPPRLPPAPRLVDAALKGLCPRCGARTLFAGWLTFADRCRVCGLDFGGFNVDDGPAAFLTLIVGTLIVVLAIWMELAFAPAWWVYPVVLVPISLVMVAGSLRIAKGALIAVEYRNAAREGRRR